MTDNQLSTINLNSNAKEIVQLAKSLPVKKNYCVYSNKQEIQITLQEIINQTQIQEICIDYFMPKKLLDQSFNIEGINFKKFTS